jgi:hypothetical protein
VYRSVYVAERVGAEWKREMVAAETTARGRREAAQAYTWEVHEVEPAEELDRADGCPTI